MDEDDPRMDSKQSVAWLIIFTDLVSLMLTFFVLLFSMSTIRTDQWDSVIDALSQSLNPSATRAQMAATSDFNIATLFRKRAINLDYLTSVLRDAASKDELLSGSQLMRLDDRLVVALPGDLLFEPGQAVLTEKALRAMFNFGGVLRNIGNQIGINGHTDPSPPAGDSYETNWELSMARAVAVANALKQSGYTEDIVAFGYASSRFDELPDMADADRRALARRVDIVIFPTVGDFR